MRKMMIFSVVAMVGCTTTNSVRKPAMLAPEGSLELAQALQQGPELTLAQLKEKTTAVPFTDLNPKDPAEALPSSLKAERIPFVVNKEKTERQSFLRKFRNWSLAKKSTRGKDLLQDFSCENSLESQALGYSLELDFPEPEASLLAQSLHEKVVTCTNLATNESLFRLAIFAIQKDECPRAETYLKMFPKETERGTSDRINYIQSFCTAGNSATKEVINANPLGGYGILLHESQTATNEPLKPTWYLATTSGSEDWDRLFATFLDLSQREKHETIRYLSTKMNFSKFRELPAPFQTSMLVLMSFSHADLSIFQTLHRYLADHPEMISPSVQHLLFPIRYWKEIVENSRKADPILVKALIRQESAFNPTARSTAKASGLMQLIYPTAKIFGVKQSKLLVQPDINIHAGSEFLSSLIEKFGSVELALAAYNAGPGMVRQWQKRYPTTNIDLFVEMIPFSETREYVRLVTRNYKIYQTLLVKPQILGDTRH